MNGAVPEREKAARLAAVQELQYGITLEKRRLLLGSEVEVLVEGPSRRDPGVLTGRTRGNAIVNFRASGRVSPGDLVGVSITGTGFLALEGDMAPHDDTHGGGR